MHVVYWLIRKCPIRSSPPFSPLYGMDSMRTFLEILYHLDIYNTRLIAR